MATNEEGNMPMQIADLVGLNETAVEDMPIVASEADMAAIWNESQSRLSIAGMRCSQGGHTAVTGGRMLLMETFSRPIEVDPGDFNAADPHAPVNHPPTVTVSAGATWSEVHHALSQHGLAPLVHQSSPHFTVGGALSVNCHGRDPRQGPLSSTVEWIELWSEQGARRAWPGEPLFQAAVGGYGSCGLILRAKLRVCPNLVLQQVGYTRNAGWYAGHLQRLVAPGPAEANIHLHYGWLRCTSLNDLFDEVLVVDYKDEGAATCPVDRDLKCEEWGDTELLRAAWAAARQGYAPLRDEIWKTVAEQQQSGRDSRLNWMRAAISFTSHRGKDATDILQEYFVPVGRFDDMRQELKRIFRQYNVNVLSATVRLVRKDSVPVNLSYCPNDAMACIAVDVSIGIEGEPRRPQVGVTTWVQECVQAALGLGGTYYLSRGLSQVGPTSRSDPAVQPGWPLVERFSAAILPLIPGGFASPSGVFDTSRLVLGDQPRATPEHLHGEEEERPGDHPLVQPTVAAAKFILQLGPGRVRHVLEEPAPGAMVAHIQLHAVGLAEDRVDELAAVKPVCLSESRIVEEAIGPAQQGFGPRDDCRTHRGCCGQIAVESRRPGVPDLLAQPAAEVHPSGGGFRAVRFTVGMDGNTVVGEVGDVGLDHIGSPRIGIVPCLLPQHQRAVTDKEAIAQILVDRVDQDPRDRVLDELPHRHVQPIHGQFPERRIQNLQQEHQVFGAVGIEHAAPCGLDEELRPFGDTGDFIARHSP
jgi:decaprenylphospho-beta-D-ribofuranose 2-oxidase